MQASKQSECTQVCILSQMMMCVFCRRYKANNKQDWSASRLV